MPTHISSQAWIERGADVFTNTPAPYFGVNTFDVKPENWDALLANLVDQQRGVEQGAGGKLHMFAAHDFGTHRRVAWVNFYETNVGHLLQPENVTRTDFPKTWDAFCQLVDNYDFFVASDTVQLPPR